MRPRSLTLAAVERYCEAKSGAVPTHPFGRTPLVFKVGGKMFALLGKHDGHDVVSLKCDPERSIVLRTSYAAIIPGYHLNKEHWNTLVLDGSLPAALIRDLIDHAHDITGRKPAKRARKRS